MKKKICLVLGVILLLLSFSLISSYFFLSKESSIVLQNSTLNEVFNLVNEKEILKEKYSALRKENNNTDIVGTLKIENTFETLFTKTDNNTYYLNHLINKEESSFGAPFMDFRSNISSGRQINIYGHNSKKYDLPFRKLTFYLEQDFYERNKYITLENDDGIYNYEIFAVKIVNDNEHMKVLFEDDESFMSHLNILKENNLYEIDLVPKKDDQILILQTCLFDDERGSYLLICAVKTKENI